MGNPNLELKLNYHFTDEVTSSLPLPIKKKLLSNGVNILKFEKLTFKLNKSGIK